MADSRPPLEILGEIERLLGSMHNETPPATPSNHIRSLVQAVEKLSQPKKARPAKCPPNYVDLWNRVGIAGALDLSNRAIRYLSWETDVAISPEFQSVALMPEKISARSIQGLVRSVHRRWDTVGSSSLGNLVVAVTTYAGKNSLIDKWKHGLQYVLNREGATRFANDIVFGGKTWEKTAEEWGIEPDSEFGNRVLEKCLTAAIAAGSAEAERVRANVIRGVLPSRHWTPSSFKIAVQQLILASSRLSPQHIELLQSYILDDSRLLDPRLPANGLNWVGISDSARDIVIQWQSAEDIQLFFDHVLPTRSDPHGRKPFWMKYKGKVKRSRPLLSSLDESRWQANVATHGKHNFGRMDYYCDTSAFLLDFGPIIVAEFSKVGNAVYVYHRRDVPGLIDSFWSSARFSLRELKQSENCIDSISHNIHWQSKMRMLLAQNGIHPGG